MDNYSILFLLPLLNRSTASASTPPQLQSVILITGDFEANCVPFDLAETFYRLYTITRCYLSRLTLSYLLSSCRKSYLPLQVVSENIDQPVHLHRLVSPFTEPFFYAAESLI